MSIHAYTRTRHAFLKAAAAAGIALGPVLAARAC